VYVSVAVTHACLAASNRDELPVILDGVRAAARAAGVEETADSLWSFFVDR
jgi:hypothetical protein